MKKISLAVVSIFLFFSDTLCADEKNDKMENDQEKMLKIRRECLNKTEATLEMVDSYKPGEEKPCEEILCFIKCNFEANGYIKDDGSVDVKKMKEDSFPEGSKESIENIYECLETVPEVKKCDDAWPLEECFVSNQ